MIDRNKGLRQRAKPLFLLYHKNLRKKRNCITKASRKIVMLLKSCFCLAPQQLDRQQQDKVEDEDHEDQQEAGTPDEKADQTLEDQTPSKGGKAQQQQTPQASSDQLWLDNLSTSPAQFLKRKAAGAQLLDEILARDGNLAVLMAALLGVGNLVFDLKRAGAGLDQFLGQQVGRLGVAEAGVDVGDHVGRLDRTAGSGDRRMFDMAQCEDARCDIAHVGHCIADAQCDGGHDGNRHRDRSASSRIAVIASVIHSQTTPSLRHLFTIRTVWIATKHLMTVHTAAGKPQPLCSIGFHSDLANTAWNEIGT